MIEVVETTIGVMFESLADSATPVCNKRYVCLASLLNRRLMIDRFDWLQVKV